MKRMQIMSVIGQFISPVGYGPRICLLACALTAASAALGHENGPEHLERFDTTLVIEASGALAITHVVDVHPHGDEIRRGIFFELPDRLGPLGDYSVVLDGSPIEPEFDDGALIAAAREPLDVHETHRFEIRYRALVPLRQRSGGDVVLRWAPVIGQFELPWRESGVTLTWPEGRMPRVLPPDGAPSGDVWRVHFEGPMAGNGRTADIAPFEIRWAPGVWPDEVVRRQVAHWGWRAALTASVLLLFGFLHTMWRAVGRDPYTGRVSPSPNPPDGISPAAARYIKRMSFDQTAFVAALVSLRVKGYMRMEIDRKDKRLNIERLEHPERADSLSPGERALARALFASGSRAVLKPGCGTGAKAMKALSRALGREHRGRHFVTNNRQRTIAFVLGLVAVTVGIAALIAEFGAVMERDQVTVALGFFTVAAGLFLPMIYFELLKAPTRAGVTVRREIEALKQYLEDPAPCESGARHFVDLLPYAIALGAEEPWRERFGDRLEAGDDAKVAETVRWYRQIVHEFESAAAMVPVIAAAAGASTAATGAAAGGASAGGV